ncbi:hypothetical protein HQQ94_00985 [Shewanella sp. VB17]|uniref:hypothetical protein n=1 Tax=Shewanella sp. VB17 TaxID=2739432 RepID=UPI001566D821|nr:hypothetical protein [Shewanella sp. VB17]NRD71844.1 hypothetical protein [Shewanella sp. VB17]
MTKSEMVTNEIFTELIDCYIEQRKNDLDGLDAVKTKEMYGGFISFYQSCGPEEKKGIMSFIETIVTDTASTILGGLDGSTDLGALTEEFTVLYEGEEIQGSLQDDFLMRVENQQD